MENYQITTEQISASSHFDENYVPSHGRLNYMGDGGAWAAKVNDLTQWIQIDLRVEANITFVATQARYDDLYQRVTQYKLQYSKDGLSFQIYKQPGENSDKVRLGAGKHVQIIPRLRINSHLYILYLRRNTPITILCLVVRPRLRHIRERPTPRLPLSVVVQTNCAHCILKHNSYRDCIYDTRLPHIHLCMSDFHSNFKLRQNSIEKTAIKTRSKDNLLSTYFARIYISL